MSQDNDVFPLPAVPNLTIGVDLGDRTSRTCELDAAGRCVRETTVATTEAVAHEPAWGMSAKRMDR